MILLGITGPIGHGKSTLADFLVEQEPQSRQAETSQVIAEVADRLNTFFAREAPTELDLHTVNQWLQHLPAILEAVTHTHIPQEKVVLLEQDVTSSPQDYQKLWEYIYEARHNPKLTIEHINAANKGAYRALLQWLGGYFVTHVDRGIWYNELVRRARHAETEGCKLFVIGGVRFPGDAEIVRAAKGRIIGINRPGVVELDQRDPTERERSKIRPDALVLNNGSLAQLEAIARELYADLLGDELRKQYATKKQLPTHSFSQGTNRTSKTSKTASVGNKTITP